MDDIRDQIAWLLMQGIRQQRPWVKSAMDEAERLLAEYDESMQVDAMGKAVLDGTIWSDG